ncbi:MAG TPA: FAD-binding domain-containing protein, partial [Acidimicrobiales bacterium]
MWFRRDLRLGDNPALAAAAASGAVVPLYVLDPALLARSGPNRVRFLLASLRALDESVGGALVVRVGDPARVVLEVAVTAMAETVRVTGDFTPYGRRRDSVVARALASDGRRLVATDSPYAVVPGTVRKEDGEPYAVFTPFSRSWDRVGWDAPVGAPVVKWAGHAIASDPLPSAPASQASLPAAGEAAAHARADAFFSGPADTYAENRDTPGRAGTSQLSVDLRWGALHPRQLLARLAPQRSHDVFGTELCWREFYADVVHHHPASAWRSHKPSMAAFPVDTDGEARARFADWARGETGYPIVDAGMRQLLSVGWMHNRVRMITASFLVKDLHLPWQWGARHFMDHLVDGDLAS